MYHQDNRLSGYDSGNYTDFTADSSEPGRHMPKSRSIPDYQNAVPNPELRVSSMCTFNDIYSMNKHRRISHNIINVFNVILRFRTPHMGQSTHYDRQWNQRCIWSITAIVYHC